MIYLIALILAALIVIGASLIFAFKDVLHVAVALSFVFLVNSLIFLLLNQPLLAVIQLFIMIGGVSVYLFVGVAAASYSHFKYTNYIALAAVAIALFAVMTYGAYNTGTVSLAHSQALANSYSAAQVVSSLTSRYTIISLYAITLMLFLLATAAIPILNRLRVI
jgi:NADH-quinone oxidoreductase subunit J